MPNAGYINEQGGSYGFEAPQVGTDKKTSQFPFFEKLAVTLSSNKASVDVAHTETLLDLGSTALGAKAELTLNVTAPVGAKLYVKYVNTTAYGVDLKIGEATVALGGSANSTLFRTLVWDGSAFNLV